MTELEQQLLNMLEAEKQEAEREREEVVRERKELASTLQSVSEAMKSVSQQQRRIIELLQKPSEGDSLEATLFKVLNSFQTSLIASLEKSLKESKS